MAVTEVLALLVMDVLATAVGNEGIGLLDKVGQYCDEVLGISIGDGGIGTVDGGGGTSMVEVFGPAAVMMVWHSGSSSSMEILALPAVMEVLLAL